MLVFRVLRACKGAGGFIGQLGEVCSGAGGFIGWLGQARIGVVGFNNSLQEASSGAGGFMWTARMCRRGFERFKFEKLPCRARNSSPSALISPQIWRLWACGANSFTEVPLEGPCWASVFAPTGIAPGLVGGVRPGGGGAGDGNRTRL